MPKIPMLKPLNTLVTINPIPLTVPTRPLALALFSAGTSNVTVVDSAILRMLPATAPAKITPENSQSSGPDTSSRTVSPQTKNIMPANKNAPKEIIFDTIITSFFLW